MKYHKYCLCQYSGVHLQWIKDWSEIVHAHHIQNQLHRNLLIISFDITTVYQLYVDKELSTPLQRGDNIFRDSN